MKIVPRNKLSDKCNTPYNVPDTARTMKRVEICALTPVPHTTRYIPLYHDYPEYVRWDTEIVPTGAVRNYHALVYRQQ